MESIQFEVGAKAARLIGRENITDVDGALIELIKNAYDADASCVCVWIDMPFPYVPTKPDLYRLQQVMTEEDRREALSFYEEKDDEGMVQKENLNEEDAARLRGIFSRYNKLIVADNGTGMSVSDVKTKWMYIGTSDKEVNYTSEKGRIKTGAKGIGRFALDKLSVTTKMFTQHRGDDLITWEIAWDQFDNSKLLNQVTAQLGVGDEDYCQTVGHLLKKNFPKAFGDKYSWDNGTAIILSPIREEWTERLFQKVNKNLRSINPLGTADPFKVYVKNTYYPEYDYETSDISIAEEDYDYKIDVAFDGEKMLTVTLHRNEVDIKRKTVTLKKIDKVVRVDSFWNRPYFQKKKYYRDDFAGAIQISRDMSNILKDDAARIRNVGAFQAELFFAKSQKSDSQIIKKVTASRRRELLNKFSGVKIYRDNFKVRPYGDEGALYDWLELGKRQAESPGGVGSDSGSWRVLAYQLMGQVQIGRETNPLLYDMANREGLTLNDEYLIFVEILQEAIHVFETDRQGFYREYTKWEKAEIEKYSKDTRIRAAAAANRDKDGKRKKSNNDEDVNTSKEEESSSGESYTEEEYQDTVYHLMLENQEKLNAEQILSMFSSSGLILNTFFHEFRAIQGHYGSRAAQLKARFRHMIDIGDLHPGIVYDPMVIIDKMETTDNMLALWLKVAMEGVKKKNLKIEKLKWGEAVTTVVDIWRQLLDSKGIKVEVENTIDPEATYEIAVADLYIILNNFFLNSVYFLEKTKNPERKICIQMKEQDDQYYFNLWNNGPELDEKYREVQNRIFELGETSKNPEDGTGIGLWIVKRAVERYGGTITPSEQPKGFGMDIYFKK